MHSLFLALTCLTVGSLAQQNAFQHDHAKARILKATQQQTVDGSYGFAFRSDNGLQRNEVSNNGVVEGSYSYIDANGETRTIKYTAGPDGFQAEGDIHPEVGGAGAAQQSAPRQQAASSFASRQRTVPTFASRQQSGQTFPLNAARIEALPAAESQARKLPPPTPVEQAQLAEQQRLLDQTIANHQQYLKQVAEGRSGASTGTQAQAQAPQQFASQFGQAPRFPASTNSFQQQPRAFQAQQFQAQAQQQFQARPQFQAQQFQAQPQFQAQQFQAQPQFQARAHQGQDFRSLQLPVQNLGNFGAPQGFRSVPAASANRFAEAQQVAARFAGPQAAAGAVPSFSGGVDGQNFKVQFAQQPGQGFNYVVQG